MVEFKMYYFLYFINLYIFCFYDNSGIRLKLDINDGKLIYDV